MSVQQTLRQTFGAIETVAIEGAGNAQFSYTEFDRPATVYNSSSSPAATKLAIDKLAMSGGAATIDLAAVPNSQGVNQDLTGLKVLTLQIYNPGDNTINIAPGSSNPYPLFGSANDIDLPPGARMSFDFGAELADVASGVKEIDISGTGTDALWYELTAGTATPA